MAELSINCAPLPHGLNVDLDHLPSIQVDDRMRGSMSALPLNTTRTDGGGGGGGEMSTDENRVQRRFAN
jgi:hypothetical protein